LLNHKASCGNKRLIECLGRGWNKDSSNRQLAGKNCPDIDFVGGSNAYIGDDESLGLCGVSVSDLRYI
jgi:hypothetical protein